MRQQEEYLERIKNCIKFSKLLKEGKGDIIIL